MSRISLQLVELFVLNTYCHPTGLGDKIDLSSKKSVAWKMNS